MYNDTPVTVRRFCLMVLMVLLLPVYLVFKAFDAALTATKRLPPRIKSKNESDL